MIPWNQAYTRLSGQTEFANMFGKGGRAPSISSFRFIAYTTSFLGVTGSASPGAAYGTTSGPIQQPFPAGAVILGVTASAYQAQETEGSFTYAPSMSPGRRDLFALNFQYTSDENITPNGLTLAEALLGSGQDTIFPAKEMCIPPSQTILVSCASIAPSPSLAVNVVWHCCVPRFTS